MNRALSLRRCWLVLLMICWPRLDRLADETRAPARAILMYHYISTPPDDADRYRRDLSVSPEQFEAQLRWLRDNGYTAISLEDVARAERRDTPCQSAPSLTFDDGYDDAYRNAFPLLQKHAMTGTFFVVTEWIDEGARAI